MISKYSFVFNAFLITLTMFGLSACGGSGGSESKENPSTNIEPPKVVNTAPEVHIDGQTEVAHQTSITFNAIASDADGDISSYLWRFDPMLPLTYDSLSNASLTITSTELEAGQEIVFHVTVVVTDNLGKQAFATHPVRVYAPAPPPLEITISGAQNIPEQQAFQLSIESSETLHEDALITWSHDSTLDLVTHGGETTTLTVTSPNILEDQTVNFTADVQLKDGRVARHMHSVIIQAHDNALPQVTISGENQALEGTTLVLSAEAFDPDGEIATYSWSHDSELDIRLAGASSQSLSASLENIISDQLVNFTVTVTDNQGATSHDSILVQFSALPNVSPTAEIQGEKTVLEQDELTLTAHASDSDGHIARYLWSYYSDLILTVSALQSDTFRIQSPDIVNDHTIDVFLTVTDNQGASHTVEHTVTIKALPNVAPDVSIQEVHTTIEKQSFDLIGIASDQDGEVMRHHWTHDSQMSLVVEGQDTATLTVTSPDIQAPHDVTFTYTATDNQGASASVSKQITIEPIQISFSVAGKVTDAPIPQARVTVAVAGTTFDTTADANGDYILDIAIDESHAEQLVKISAQGVNDQSSVTLVSQLNSVATIKQAAGEDNVVNSDELFDVNVTNVTTAEYALLGRDKQGYRNGGELNEAKARISSQEQLTLAAVLKAVIDHDVALPAGADSTLELVQNSELTDELLENLMNTQPELFEKIKSDITNDDTLVDPITFSPSGSYYLVETKYTDGLDYQLTFYPGQRGVLSTADKNTFFSWTQNGQKLNFTLDEEVLIKNKRLEYRTGFHTTSFSITAYDVQKRSLAVMVEFDLSKDIEEIPSGKYSTAAQMFGEADLHTLTEEELLGTWSLNYERFGKLNTIEITFEKGGTLTINANIGELQGTWSIYQGQLIVDQWLYTFNLKLVREFNFGYQTIVETGSFWDKEYRQGTFVKHQNVTFDDIDYQKTWRKVRSRQSHSAFVIDESDNFNFRWHRDIQGTNEEGTLKHFEYSLDGKYVEFCNVELNGCDITTTSSYKLLGRVDDTIAVSYLKRKHYVSDNDYDIHFYKLSDKTWALGEFTKSFFHTDKLEQLFGAKTHLYSVEGDTVVHLYSKFYCPTNPAPLRTCFDSIIFDGERYKATLEDTLLKLEHLQSGAISYMTITDETSDALTLCHFSEGTSCSEGNRYSFAFSKPELSVVLSQIGEGELTTSQSKFHFGDSFNVTISEVDDYIFGSISGCDGKLKKTGETTTYQVRNLQSSCKITATFKELTAHKRTSLLLDATPTKFIDSWYYTFNSGSQNTGVFHGLDKNSAFSVQSVKPDMYMFEFEDILRTRVNGHAFYASKFSLQYHADSMLACWYGSKTDPHFDPSSEHLLEACTNVELATSKPAHEVGTDELIGEWYLNFDQSLNLYQLTLTANNTGTIEHIGNDNTLISSHPVSWQLNSDNILEITDETGTVASLSVIHKNASLYNLLAKESDSVNKPAWLHFGTWSMIRKARETLTIEQLAGVWRNTEAAHIDEFYLFPDGAYRIGRLNGAAIASVENNILKISAKFNSTLNRYEHMCDIASADCKRVPFADYKILAIDNNLAYVRTVLPGADGSIISVIEIDNTIAAATDNPVYLKSTTYYEIVNDALYQWQFDYNEQDQTVTIIFNNGFTTRLNYRDGKIESDNSLSVTNYTVIDITATGLTLCRAISAPCDEESLIRLSFQLPYVAVSLDIPDELQPNHNVKEGYLLLGQQLEVRLPMWGEREYYASSFSGCGISKPEIPPHNSVANFTSEPLYKPCSFHMAASPIPESNADRLGITDPLLKQCIDHKRSEYIEYSSALSCNGYNRESDLVGIDKLKHVNTLALTNVRLTDAGKQQLGALTNLESLTYGLGWANTETNSELNLSNLTKLKTLKLERVPDSKLILPYAPALQTASFRNVYATEVELSGFPALETLNIDWSHIKALDLSNNKLLAHLSARSAQIHSITGVTPEHKLQEMDLHNSKIETIDLTGFDKLTRLDLSHSQLTEIDISKARSLESFDASSSNLHDLYFESTASVIKLNIDHTEISQLSMHMMPRLKDLLASRTKLLHLDLSTNSQLYSVNVTQGSLKTILLPDSIEGSNARFMIRQNEIESLTIPENLKGIVIDASQNHINQLSVLGAPVRLSVNNNLLEEVSIHLDSRAYLIELKDNNISRADISGEIDTLDLSNNQLAAFSLPQDTAIRALNLAHNAIENMTLPSLSYEMRHFNATHNPLKHIAFEGGKYGQISLSYTELTQLDLSNLAHISNLQITDTQIASLDLHATLHHLSADNVPLTSLAIPQGSRLSSMSFKNNKLNSMLGLENIERYFFFTLNGTEVDKDLEATLRSKSNIVLYGL
ncbi:hypothetical protein L1286_17220 [Pseudoalteromonas sp. SMS1]|uniref:PKD domain-containing protein n=1 Tax=Pseudoalteromonas sp. SMS1 TaxID=2908894 RepID=UPI001F24975B|nr:REJ domain-containing protein [Pseudoalteromonas sp. SMS1]MCF2859227.1 hypothetical protein [Pseudoalteromonas sp. SMS1]